MLMLVAARVMMTLLALAHFEVRAVRLFVHDLANDLLFHVLGAGAVRAERSTVDQVFLTFTRFKSWRVLVVLSALLVLIVMVVESVPFARPARRVEEDLPSLARLDLIQGQLAIYGGFRLVILNGTGLTCEILLAAGVRL